MKQDFQIVPAQLEDVNVLARIYVDAFSQNPFVRLIFKDVNEIEQIEWSKRMLEWNFSEMKDTSNQEEETRKTKKSITTVLKSVSSNTGKIIAFAIWKRITNPDDEKIDLDNFPRISGLNYPLFLDFMKQTSEKAKQLMAGKSFYYLFLIACNQEYTGHGATSGLLHWGIDKADSEGIDSYLESSKSAKLIYIKYGFKESQETISIIEGLETAILIRPPNITKSDFHVDK